MKVRELMTADAKACGPSDSLNRAAQLMWENDCGAIPVVDEELRVIGMVTDRDICMAAYTQGRTLKQSLVDSAMSKGAFTCALGDDIAAADKLMCERQVRRLPVVDDEGRLAGIISLSDIAREADRERASKSRRRQIKDTRVVEILGAVCAPNGNGAAHAA